MPSGTTAISLIRSVNNDEANKVNKDDDEIVRLLMIHFSYFFRIYATYDKCIRPQCQYFFTKSNKIIAKRVHLY